jgi:hypothetical protein
MPANTPRDMIEHTRERLMRYPILLVPQPLANFSLTRRTFRSTDYTGWGQSQAMLGASFLRQVPMTPAACRQLWAHRRQLRPRASGKLLFAALLARKFRFLVYAQPADWLGFLAGCVRHPFVTLAILCAKQRHADFWNVLNKITAARISEAHDLGFRTLDTNTLLDKQHPSPVT